MRARFPIPPGEERSAVATYPYLGSTFEFIEKLGAPFTIVFGQTECSPVAAQTRTTDSVEDKANTIGLPLPNMENKIIDPNTGETVPIGTIGEFCTRGYHVMRGYVDDPEATHAAIDADGALASRVHASITPEAVVVDRRGAIRYRGRIDNFYAALGRPRQSVTAHDLRDALGAIAAGRMVASPETEPVGCYIVPRDVRRQ